MTAVAPNSLVQPTTAVERLEPLRPMPVNAVQRAMVEYQNGLQAILADSDWQTFIGRDAREHRFVKRSGWRKIATWFGLDLQLGEMVVERDDQDRPLRARVVGRAIAPNGRQAEDVGACSIDERNFSKPEHDLLGTAATRALNRAISNLVGMGEVSAEEVDERDVAAAPELPEWAKVADGELLAPMAAKLTTLVGDKRAEVLMRAIDERYGGIPNIATGFVNAIYSMLADELAKARVQTPQEG